MRAESAASAARSSVDMESTRSSVLLGEIRGGTVKSTTHTTTVLYLVAPLYQKLTHTQSLYSPFLCAKKSIAFFTNSKVAGEKTVSQPH